ncbi:MAG: DUF4388 domain-containing protein [Pseudomonadota bacterium]
MGLKGTLADMGIIDLLQFPRAGRKSGELVITAKDAEAHLYYDKGALVHAVEGDAQAMDALVRIVDWRQATFEFVGDVAPPAKTIELDLHRAVMQALKLHDELKEAEQKKMTADTPRADAKDRVLARRLAEFTAAGEHILHACVISNEGNLRAAADSRTGTPDGVEALRSLAVHLLKSHPRADLSKVFLVDALGTVVLVRLQTGDCVMVVAGKEATLGAVSMSAGRLAAGLE